MDRDRVGLLSSRSEFSVEMPYSRDESEAWTRRMDVVCSREWNFEGFFDLLGIKRDRFFAALRSTHSIALGPSLVDFMKAPEEFVEAKQPLRMDILCTNRRSAGVLRKMLIDSGYTENLSMCRHPLGEWAAVPRGKVTCMVRGALHGRTVHLVEVPTTPVQVVLSRVYGSQCGTYLDEKERVVSLFPHLTFLQTRIWLPVYASEEGAKLVAMKYSGMVLEKEDMDPGPWEIFLRMRYPDDQHCFVVSIHPDGKGGVVRRPVGVQGCVSSSGSAASVEQYGELFRTMRAPGNAGGVAFEPSQWMWPGQKPF